MANPVPFLASAVAVFMATMPAFAAEPPVVIRTVRPQRNYGALPPADASTFDLVRPQAATAAQTTTEFYDDSIPLDPQSYSALAEMEAAADEEMAALSDVGYRSVGYGSPYRPWIYRPSYAYRYGLYPYRAYGVPYYGLPYFGGYGPRYLRPYGWAGFYGSGPRYSFSYDVTGLPFRALYGPTYGASRWDVGVIGYTHPLHYRGYEGCLYW